MLIDSNGYIYADARGYLYMIDPHRFSIVQAVELPQATDSSGSTDPFTA